MKILILNGSPKGMQSVTMQHMLYLQKIFPEHEFTFQHISQRIKRLNENESAFSEIIAAVQSADGVLWATPVYYFLVPGQYKRFIELVFERHAQQAFSGKYAAVLTTSIHFFDHTANHYLQSICDDFGMRFVAAFPAGMQDMTTPEGRLKLRQFGEHFFQAIASQKPVWRRNAPLHWQPFTYQPGEPQRRVNAAERKVLLVNDAGPADHNLQGMIERFCNAFTHPIEVINLGDVDIKGGCQGCLHCGYSNECTYQGKDGFLEFYDEKVRKADLLVIAGSIHDRYLSAKWKTFFDRSFFRGHAPSLSGKHLAYLVSGPLSQLANLQQILQGYTGMQRCNLAGMLSDESGSSTELDGLIQDLAEKMVSYAKEGYFQPDTFLYYGGIKLFRDELFGNLRAIFRADHRLYSKLGIYDFPTKNIVQRLMNNVAGLVFKIPAIRRGFQRMIKQGMLQGYKKYLEEV